VSNHEEDDNSTSSAQRWALRRSREFCGHRQRRPSAYCSFVAFITELWCDGACSGNPGPGGWAYILLARRPDGSVAKKLEGHGGEDMTTNNRMELRAVVEGLLALTRPTTTTIHPDSAYLANAFTEGWLAKWQSNGWKSGKKPVKNQDLWVALLAAIEPHTVTWKRVKGHSTAALNNRCDALAVHERDIHAGRIPVGTPPPACAKHSQARNASIR
jgi:ribonuclease HI